MRVKHLSASHFRGFEKLDIDFSATNLTVFIGTNGQGKSSLLDLIAAHLNQFVFNLNQKFMKREGTDGFLQNKDIKNFSTEMQSKIRFLVPPNYLPKEQDTPYEPSDTILLNAANDYSEHKIDDVFFSFSKNLGQKIILKPFFSAPVFAYYRASRTVNSDAIVTNEQMPSVFTPLKAYDNAFSKTQNNFDDFFTWFKIEEDEENAAIRQEKNFDLRNPQLEVVRTAITHFFSFLSGDKYGNLRIERANNSENQGMSYKSNGTSILVLDKNDENLSVNQLSDGEKSVIMLVCDIARRLAIANPIEKNGDFSTILKNGNGVVLIDEIDLHLHPLWQKEILQALVKTFPSLQFIVTTHSPYVVTHLDLDDSQVQVLSITKNGVIPVASKGKDLSTASFEIFGVERRPKQYQSLIDDLFREFEAETPNFSVLDKKFLDLKKRLGATDPEVQSAKIILEGLKL